MGKILARSGSDDAAIAEVRTALNLKPDLPDAHLQLGSLLLNTPTQHREALEQLQQAVTLAPSDVAAHYSYAMALAVNGDKERAAKQREIGDGSGGYTGPKRIRVGGRVQSAKLISKPPPRYPQKAKAAHIEGTVRLEVLMDKDGAVKDIEVTSGDPLLSEAAVKAVRRWRYQPTLLNGEPVEVVTEVDVNFNLN